MLAEKKDVLLMDEWFIGTKQSLKRRTKLEDLAIWFQDLL